MSKNNFAANVFYLIEVFEMTKLDRPHLLQMNEKKLT